MLRLAVTGGVASGKTTVLAALRELGVPTLDLDRLCREAVAPGRPELERIRTELGEEYVSGAGLERARLRELISRDAGARRRLEAIIHPPVLAEMERALAELAAAGHPLAAVEVPLLYETGLTGRFDAVIVATCPRQLALERLVERSGLGREAALRLMAAQLPLEEKAARADFIVDTGGSLEAVTGQVERILQGIKRGKKKD